MDVEFKKFIKMSGTETIDRAIEMAGIGRFQYIMLTVASSAGMAVVFENQCMSYVLPAARCDLGISLAEQGFINSVSFIGVIVASHLWGFMTDTWGRRRTLRLTLALTFVASALSSMSWSSSMLMISRFFVGFCTAGVKISQTAYYSEFFPNHKMSKYFTFLTTFNTFGFVLQPLLGLAVMTMDWKVQLFRHYFYTPWRLFTLLGSTFTALPLFALYFLPEGPKYLVSIGRREEALQTLQQIYTCNTSRPKEDFAVSDVVKCAGESTGQNLAEVQTVRQAIRLVWNQTWPLFVRPHAANMIIMCLLMFFTFAVGQGTQLWGPQIFVYFQEVADLKRLTTCESIRIGHARSLNSSSQTAINGTAACEVGIDPGSPIILVLIGVAVMAIIFVAGFSIEKLGKQIVNTSWLLANALATFGLILSTSYWLNVLFMVFLISTVPLMNNHAAISGELFTTKYKGMAVSLMLMSARIGSIVGSNILSKLLFSVCQTLFSMNAFILFVATIVCWYTLRKRDEPIEQMDEQTNQKVYD